MNHRYIDEHCVAERYLEHALPPPEHDAFESHLVACDECTDRLLLAQIFLDHKAIGTAHAGSSATQEPVVETGAAPSSSAGAVSSAAQSEQAPAASPADAAERDTDTAVARPWPKRAHFVAQFTPWQLFFLAVGAAAWLLLVPTAYFLGQLSRLSGGH